MEFLRARARAQRFAEEVQILLEEQRRILQSFSRQASMWERRAVLAGEKECLILRQGAVAYAEKQKDLYERLRTRFSQMWTSTGLASGASADPGREAVGLDELRLFTISQDIQRSPS